jgi:hypothetical protein
VYFGAHGRALQCHHTGIFSNKRLFDIHGVSFLVQEKLQYQSKQGRVPVLGSV